MYKFLEMMDFVERMIKGRRVGVLRCERDPSYLVLLLPAFRAFGLGQW
jgi:hypothetical protein